MRNALLLAALLVALSLPTLAPAAQVGSVLLDPGHGGYSFGINAGNIKEKDVALKIAKSLRRLLTKRGKKVFLTRTVDQHLAFKDRRERIEEHSADIMLSVHMSDTDSAMLYVSWYRQSEADLSLKQYYSLQSRQRRYLYESGQLASAIGEALSKEFGISVFHGELPLPLLGSTGSPAVLVELPSKGFDYNKSTVRRFSGALGQGIGSYEQQ